jgi:putative ABC transport system permease protein
MTMPFAQLDYYFRLGVAGLGRNRLLTGLMVLAIGLGIGAFMTTYNLYYMMSSDPIPAASDRLYNLRLDITPAGDDGYDTVRGDNLPPLMSWRDSRALLDAGMAEAQTAHYRTWVTLKPDRPDVRAGIELTRAASTDFFGMYRVPFLHGSGWSQAQEDNRERVAVIEKALSERVFGTADSVGETLTINDEPFRIVGVLDGWQPTPRFHDLVNGPFRDNEQLYIPFSLVEPMELPVSGQFLCPENPESGFGGMLRSNCNWINYWVELPDASARASFEHWLEGYIASEHQRGRFQNSQQYRLHDVNAWLKAMNVVGEDTPMLVAAAFLFLMVCLINTVSLLLAKFLARTKELGIRRALGASRGAIFAQHMAECVVLGMVGAAFGLAMTWAGLRALDALYSDLSRLVALSWPVVGLTIVAAVGSAIAVGIYPAWRASRIQPAAQIRAA